MKPSIFKCLSLIILCCYLASNVTGCNLCNKSDNKIVNEYLASNNAINDPKAQPVTPGSGEFFAEGAKIFDLTAIPNVKMLNSSNTSSGRPIKLFMPSSSPALNKILNESATASFYRDEEVQSGIPSTKSHDVIPEQCRGLEDQDQRDCMLDAKDNDNVTTTMGDKEHHSYHDAGTLEAQLGPDIESTIINKAMTSFLTNFSAAKRQELLATLQSAITANAYLSDVDFSDTAIFDPAQYNLGAVTVSDASEGYLDNDSRLDDFTTVSVELKRVIHTGRKPFSDIDDCAGKYGEIINPRSERFLLSLVTYIHLDDQQLHRILPPDPPLVADNETALSSEQDLGYLEQVQKTKDLNHAYDANLIKMLFTDNGTFPWSSTEYQLHFLLAPENADQYISIISQSNAAGDQVCYDSASTYLQPYTSIITGSETNAASVEEAARTFSTGEASTPKEVKLFYQLPTHISSTGSEAEMSAVSGGASSQTNDYCMVDENGNQVAIVDPGTGAIVLACERSKITVAHAANESHSALSIGEPLLEQQLPAMILPLFTKKGACLDDKNDWAYWPSRLRSDRFGRGCQLILTEWLIHNQTADYKNIHWYQSGWKAGVQVAVKAASYIVATWLKIQAGTVVVPSIKKGTEIVIAVYIVLPWMGDVLIKTGNSAPKIAGYSLKYVAKIGQTLSQKNNRSTNSTFSSKMGSAVKGAVINFFIDRTTDALCEILDVEIVGWQDFSDGSHKGCFQFD